MRHSLSPMSAIAPILCEAGRIGHIILTGAPGKVEEIKAGDAIEVEIPAIGCLRNPVVGEK